MPPDRPQITYPCAWGYRLIGADEAVLRAAVVAAVAGAPVTFEGARPSGGGRYVALRIVVTVADEAERLHVYAALQAHEGVRLVL